MGCKEQHGGGWGPVTTKRRRGGLIRRQPAPVVRPPSSGAGRLTFWRRRPAPLAWVRSDGVAWDGESAMGRRLGDDNYWARVAQQAAVGPIIDLRPVKASRQIIKGHLMVGSNAHCIFKVQYLNYYKIIICNKGLI